MTGKMNESKKKEKSLEQYKFCFSFPVFSELVTQTPSFPLIKPFLSHIDT